MEWRNDRIFDFALFVPMLFSLAIIPTLNPFEAHAASSFGIDYRHLTTVSPGGTPNTTTTIAVGAGATGTFIVNPYTSGSTATGTPTTTSMSGYGWRTVTVIGSSVPAGTWSFTVTTQSSLTSLLGNGKVKVYAYAADTLGSNLSFIGSATGTSNVFSALTAQTETISFSTAVVDVTNKVIVVEYWLDVTTGPLVATTVTFQAASSTQTVVLPSSSDTFYLGNPSLFSVGETESAPVTDTISRSVASTRAPLDSAITSDSIPSRALITSRATIEASGAVATDSVSKFTGFMRQTSESSGATISDSTSRIAAYARQTTEDSDAILTDEISRNVASLRLVSEISSAAVTDSVAQAASYVRQVSDTAGAAASDSVSNLMGYARQVSESSGALVTDSISRDAVFARGVLEISASVSDWIDAILNALSPPPDDEDEKPRNPNGGREITTNLTFDPSYFEANPLDRVVFINVVILNSEGAQFPSTPIQKEVKIVCRLFNQQTMAQEYVLVIQIVDGQDAAQHIALLTGSLEKGQIMELSHNWTAHEASNYGVQIMVLDKVEDSPIILSEKISRKLVVIEPINWRT